MSDHVNHIVAKLADDIRATVRGAVALDGRVGARQVATMIDGELAVIREQLRTGEFKRREEEK